MRRSQKPGKPFVQRRGDIGLVQAGLAQGQRADGKRGQRPCPRPQGLRPVFIQRLGDDRLDPLQMMAAKRGHFLVLGGKLGDAIDQQAAMLAAGRVRQRPQHGGHRLCPVRMRRIANGFQRLKRRCRIAPQGGQQHILLGAKGGIKGGTADPHRLCQVVQRRRLETLTAEQLKRRTQNLTLVIGTRAARTGSCTGSREAWFGSLFRHGLEYGLLSP